jgi:hypothetical protein
MQSNRRALEDLGCGVQRALENYFAIEPDKDLSV